jgi:predicted alpha/beta-hydrolase family hydrolase
VLCLAFPLQTPKGANRLSELEAVAVPTLVVQGVRDRFGMPPAGPRRTVAEVASDHGLKTDLHAVADAVRAWLTVVLEDDR